jgi:hypothetical protein
MSDGFLPVCVISCKEPKDGRPGETRIEIQHGRDVLLSAAAILVLQCENDGIPLLEVLSRAAIIKRESGGPRDNGHGPAPLVIRGGGE